MVVEPLQDQGAECFADPGPRPSCESPRNGTPILARKGPLDGDQSNHGLNCRIGCRPVQDDHLPSHAGRGERDGAQIAPAQIAPGHQRHAETTLDETDLRIQVADLESDAPRLLIFPVRIDQRARSPTRLEIDETLLRAVEGALLSVGDPHACQGDGETCGTAIECSLTGRFQIVLHKRADLRGKSLSDLNYPLIETAEEWVICGFSHPNYLEELGQNAQSDIYRKSSLDHAMRDAFRKVRRFLMGTFGLSEDEAISLISVAVDFGITQVADGNWGVHAVVRKDMFPQDRRSLT